MTIINENIGDLCQSVGVEFRPPSLPPWVSVGGPAKHDTPPEEGGGQRERAARSEWKKKKSESRRKKKERKTERRRQRERERGELRVVFNPGEIVSARRTMTVTALETLMWRRNRAGDVLTTHGINIH